MALPKILHPTFTIKLLLSQKEIQVRPMLVKEEKILLIAKESGEPADIFVAVKQVCNNCLLTKFDINTLSLIDLEYLFIKIRSVSVSNLTKVSYKDLEDEQVYDFDVDLDKIELKWAAEKVEPEQKINDSVSVMMRFPPATLYDSASVLLSESSSTESAESIFINSIDAIFNMENGKKIVVYPAKDVSSDQLKQFVEDLPVETYEKLKQFVASAPTLYYKIEYENKKGSKRLIELTTLNDFFTLV